MKLNKISILFFLFTVLIFIFSKCFFISTSSVSLLISSAASLQPVMEELKIIYETNNSEVQLNYNFGSSGLLAKQIEQGIAIDIFFSASSLEVEKLQKKDLIINDSIHNIVSNNLILVKNNKNKLTLNNIQQLTDNKIKKIIIGTPEIVPVGRYAQQVLNYYNIWSKIQDKLVFTKDEPSILSYLKLGYGDVGFVYQSSMNRDNDITIMTIVPSKSHQSIIYPICILKKTLHRESAENFINFLMSNEAQDIFKKYQFSPVSIFYDK